MRVHILILFFQADRSIYIYKIFPFIAGSVFIVPEDDLFSQPVHITGISGGKRKSNYLKALLGVCCIRKVNIFTFLSASEHLGFFYFFLFNEVQKAIKLQ